MFEVGPDDVTLHPDWIGTNHVTNGNDIALVRLPAAVRTANQDPEVGLLYLENLKMWVFVCFVLTVQELGVNLSNFTLEWVDNTDPPSKQNEEHFCDISSLLAK